MLLSIPTYSRYHLPCHTMILHTRQLLGSAGAVIQGYLLSGEEFQSSKKNGKNRRTIPVVYTGNCASVDAPERLAKRALPEQVHTSRVFRIILEHIILYLFFFWHSLQNLFNNGRYFHNRLITGIMGISITGLILGSSCFELWIVV